MGDGEGAVVNLDSSDPTTSTSTATSLDIGPDAGSTRAGFSGTLSVHPQWQLDS